jgi:PAS domain S-box-containing protein
MKIRTKIISGFILMSLIISFAGYFYIDLSRSALEEEIGISSMVLVNETVMQIDRNIYRRMEEWQVRKDIGHFQDLIKKSNDEFSELDDIEEYIDRQDKKWINSAKREITPFMKGLIDNDLSNSMRKILRSYEEKYGYTVFGEIFITNKYGANVALTNKTTDFRQNDEQWWQKAKEDGLYIGNMVYDESIEKYSIDLVMRVDDKDGNFIGILNAVLNIDEAVEVLGEVKSLEKERTLEFILSDKNGETIYSTKDFSFSEKISPEIFSKVNSYPINNDGYFISEDGKQFIAYARSLGYKEFEGFGWILLSTHETKEIFVPITRLRNIIFLITILVLVISILVAYFISLSILNPIDKLRRGVEIVEEGNLNYKIASKAKDEIGTLSRFFDRMILSLKKTNIEINKKVQEQTVGIKKNAIDLENQQSAILNVLEDVEKEKLATEKEKNKINTILHGIGDGVFVVDKDLKIILFNPVASEISGFSASEVMNKRYATILKFIYETSRKVNDVFIKKAMKTGKITEMSNHTILIRKDGKKVPVADSAAPLKNKNGDITGCVVVFRDVTAEREIDKAKSEFVSIASHQLGTPLTGIKWFIELLVKEKAGKLNKKQFEFLQQIFDINERMISLVNDLLNVSRLELGTFVIEPKDTNLAEIADSSLNELTPQIKEKKIKISKKISDSIGVYRGDPKLLRIIFQNLFSNAIKYTPKGGKVSISLKKTKTDIFCSISDTGIGIPKKQHNRIFTKLFRADNVAKIGVKGTGLGLYIAKTILENSGGKIWFESNTAVKGKKRTGTIFYFTLPLNGMKERKGTKQLT